jgi:hypothetical protein
MDMSRARHTAQKSGGPLSCHRRGTVRFDQVKQR